MRQEIRERSRALLRDAELQANLRRALSHSLARRLERVNDNPRWPLRREQAAAIRESSLGHMRELLAALERRLVDRGAKVFRCETAAQARARVVGLLQEAGARTVVKGKSMVSEEIDLNPAMEASGIEVAEGDLGELIVQLRKEAPAHITAPALHLNRHQIANLFRQAFGAPLSAEPAALARAARRYLWPRFLKADAGVTGANFLVAESGSVVLVENESNIRLATTLPRLHIVVAGIERVVPRLTDIAPLLELLAPSATGQKSTAAVSILGGPRGAGEIDGPENLALVLVDNGRSRLLADPRLRPALRCIRCGACLNVCPVFQRLGGHGYGSVYPGPIGVVLSRELLGQRDAAHAFACSLCGACDDICPVQIPLSKLILEVRGRCQRDAAPALEALGHRAFSAAATRPALFNHAVATLLRGLGRIPPRWSVPLVSAWTSVRASPRVVARPQHRRTGSPR